MDVLLCKAAEKDAVKTRVEPVQVGTTDVTDTRLGLERNTQGRKGTVSLVRKPSAAGESPQL